MFDTMKIRVKLVVALAIPLVVLFGLSTFVVVISDQQARDARARALDIGEQVALATASLGPQGVIGALQTERNSEAIALAGVDLAVLGGESIEAGVLAPGKARSATDAAITQFKNRIAASPPSVQEIYRPAVAAVDTVAEIRQHIDSSTDPHAIDSPTARRSFREYSTVVRALFEANSETALTLDDADLRNGATMIDLMSRLREDGSDMTFVLVNHGVAGSDVTDKQVTEVRTRERLTDETLRREAIGPYRQIVERGLNDPRITAYRETVRQLYEGESTNVFSLIDPSVARIWGAFGDLDKAIGEQLDRDAAAVQAAAEQEAADAESRQRTVILVGIAALLAAAAVTYVAARSISRPLLRLARDADDMATHRLPDAVKQILETPPGDDVVMPELAPVPGGGGAEINEVAVALNSVQSSAAGLAVEQALLRRNIADSFVNLGRRNQNLLSRQIDSITQMERDEADPDILERLFKLDHLATRMRRNAESLLLLGGQEPHRQWSAPVPLVQVIRGAMGEVEDYQRIAIRSLDDAYIKGATAADVTHLVAELLENALRFSPPNREVEIVGRATEGDYSLAIVDAGLGMSEQDLERANRRLLGQESFTVAPSRYLGHYVVGVQAARLGVQVRLQNSPGSGVTARILLGDTLAEAPAEPVAAPQAEAPTEVQAAPRAEAPDEAPEAPAAEVAAPAAPKRRHQFVEEPAPASAALPRPAPAPEPAAAPEAAEQATARADLAVSPPATPAVTASGYTRRQRGAHVPRTDVAPARGDTGAGDRTTGEPVNKADSVRDLLSGLQAGADRARAESSGAASTQEDLS